MRQFPKVSQQFKHQYFYYSHLPINKTVSFRLPSELAEDFTKAVQFMGAKSSDELRNFMIDYISYALDKRKELQQQNEQRATF